MGQKNGENGSGGSNLRMLILLLLPVLLILLISFMPSQEPIYSLSRSRLYKHKFTTPKGVNYYVKSKNFDQEYPPNSRERYFFERSIIEREYASMLHHNCILEMQRRQWGYVVETPHCNMFRQFQAAA